MLSECQQALTLEVAADALCQGVTGPARPTALQELLELLLDMFGQGSTLRREVRLEHGKVLLKGLIQQGALGRPSVKAVAGAIDSVPGHLVQFEKPIPCQERVTMVTQAGNDQTADTPRPLYRITRDPQVMEGKACIQGMRVTAGMSVGQIGAGRTLDNVLDGFPYLEREDVMEAIQYAAWLTQEPEIVQTTG